MKLSFKLKIALLSFTVSGALLMAFGIIFFAFAFRSGIDRMDREIRTLAESSLHGIRPGGYWENFDRSLQFIYGESNPARLALFVVDSREHVVFQSGNAPSELAALPRPQRGGPAAMGGPDVVDHFFERLDRNRDHLISSDEFDGPVNDFIRFDGNRDGTISIDEIGRIEDFQVNRPPIRRDLASEEPPTFQILETASGNWRVGTFHDPQLAVFMAMDMGVFYEDINRFRTAFMIAVPLGLVLLGLASWFLAARSMKPVAVIANTAEGITARALGRRIPSVGTDSELEQLVTVVNGMLDRLEKSYSQAVRFSADAAHELQTPLTILQGELDNAIQTSENGSEEQQRYSRLLEELRNLKAVVQKLLLLAHADEGRLNLNRQPVDLSDLLLNAVEDLEMMAPELIRETCIPEHVHVSADPALLNQTLRNMVSNAAKYTNPKGRVVFVLEQDSSAVRFTLANAAPPIPEDDRPLLFDRFHRVDKARSTSGSGLGLSLAREIARAHDGDLVLNPCSKGMVSFTLTLPVKQTA